MSQAYDYLRAGLLQQGTLRAGLQMHANAVAQRWLAAGVNPADLEIIAEYLVRSAGHLGSATLDSDSLLAGLTCFDLPEPLVSWLQLAMQAPLDATGLAALAIHLLDVTEAMALRIYVPELTALVAKSDRSGDAARRVGAARHLRG